MKVDLKVRELDFIPLAFFSNLKSEKTIKGHHGFRLSRRQTKVIQFQNLKKFRGRCSSADINRLSFLQNDVSLLEFGMHLKVFVFDNYLTADDLPDRNPIQRFRPFFNRVPNVFVLKNILRSSGLLNAEFRRFKV